MRVHDFSIIGQGNNDVDYQVTLKNIELQGPTGIIANGNAGQSGAKIVASNCTFIGSDIGA